MGGLRSHRNGRWTGGWSFEVAPGGYQGGMTDPVELSELHAGGADPDDVTPEEPHENLDGTDEDVPAEAGLPVDGTTPAGEDPTQP